MKIIRVILADDHEVVRSGVRAHLDNQGDIQVVGEAENGVVLLDMVDRFKPDVVVADIEMEGLNGLEALGQALKQHPKLGGVILSMHDDRPYIKRAWHYGILGFVSKLDKSQEVINAIRHAANRQRYLSPRAQKNAPPDDTLPDDEDNGTPLDVLTPREVQVLQLTAEGKTSAEAAEILMISVRTVEVHRARLMKRLGLKNRVALVKFAAKYGVIPKE